jgi:hypothetical protein
LTEERVLKMFESEKYWLSWECKQLNIAKLIPSSNTRWVLKLRTYGRTGYLDRIVVGEAHETLIGIFWKGLWRWVHWIWTGILSYPMMIYNLHGLYIVHWYNNCELWMEEDLDGNDPGLLLSKNLRLRIYTEKAQQYTCSGSPWQDSKAGGSLRREITPSRRSVFCHYWIWYL